MLLSSRLSSHFLSRPSPYLFRPFSCSATRSLKRKDKDTGDQWVQDVFSTRVNDDSGSTQSTSLGGIFDSVSEEPTPSATTSTPSTPSTPGTPQIEQSDQLLLAKKIIPRSTPKYRVPRTEFRGRTSYLPASVRKINPLACLIARKPIDWAILQMRFNEKKYSKDIEELLLKVKADVQRVRPSLLASLVVDEIWVAKGPNQNKRIDIKGRGRFGVMKTRTSRVFVVVKCGQTIQDLKNEKRRKQLKRIVSAAMVREDVPIRNAGGLWRW